MIPREPANDPERASASASIVRNDWGRSSAAERGQAASANLTASVKWFTLVAVRDNAASARASFAIAVFSAARACFSFSVATSRAALAADAFVSASIVF